MKMKRYLIVIFVLFGFIGGCATTLRLDCKDDALVAATIYGLRTGEKTYIAISKDRMHVQAFAEKNGEKVWLHVCPTWQWSVFETEQDSTLNGIGFVYTKEQFIKLYSIVMKLEYK